MKLPKHFPCPVCFGLRKIQLSIKSKPYYVCPACMTQVFIRGHLGIERLSEYEKRPQLLKRLEAKKLIDCAEILNAIERIKIIKFQISQNPQKKSKNDRLQEQLVSIKNKIEGFVKRKLIPQKGAKRGNKK